MAALIRLLPGVRGTATIVVFSYCPKHTIVFNTQYPFRASFSSNHLEKNLPYVNLIEALMPVRRQWHREYYELPGAYFPHSAFPVKMTITP